MTRPPVRLAAAARVINAALALMRWMRPRRRRRIRVSRVSEEWLRTFEKEASKHQPRDDA